MELTYIEKGELTMKYNYFDVPTQVKFWDYGSKHYYGGIAFQDKIICGCCGGVCDISEIYRFAPDTLEKDPIIAYDNWACISSAICGDDN
jgi:hypothetical protein